MTPNTYSLLLLGLCVAGSAMAAPVTFTTSLIDKNDTTGSFLDNGGTILEAVNFGPTRTGPFTYNAPTTASNPDPLVTLNGIAFASSGGVNNPGGTYFATSGVGNGSLTVGYDNGRFSDISEQNQALYGLTYDVIRSGANNTRLQLTLQNLTVGMSYQLQMVFSTLNSANNPAGNMADRQVQVSAGTFTQGANTQNGTGADGDTAFLAYGPTSGARVVTASFTADGTSELFSLLSGTEGGNSRVSLAGVVIAQVPEPNAAALVGIGAALAMAARRKKSA